MPKLSEELGPRIFIKRDDLTGLAFGGNKGRKLEYLMGDALKSGANHIVTGAGFHSNWCTQTAAAARRMGMKVTLVKSAPEDGYDPEEYDGNHLLHFLLGANIRTVKPENFTKTISELAEEVEASGDRPYVMGVGGSNHVGATGYANAILELLQQSVETGLKIDYVVHASGSGGTQAGLVAGSKALNSGIKIIGIGTGGSSAETQSERLIGIVNDTFEFLEVDESCDDEDIVFFDGYAGEAYGFMTEEKAAALSLVAKSEGLFLDPVYTGSAMAGLIALSNEGFFTKDDTVVFVHTGGPVALFPYKAPLKAYGNGKPMPWTIPPWSPRAG